MSEAKLCPCCGAKMVEYKHGLSKGLLRGFARVLQRHENKNAFDFKDCEFLTYSQASNMQKLQHWGLIEKENDSSGRGGHWLITDLALSFMKGNIPMPLHVWTYRGKRVRFSEESKYIHEITDGWRYRIDYALDSVNHNERGVLV